MPQDIDSKAHDGVLTGADKLHGRAATHCASELIKDLDKDSPTQSSSMHHIHQLFSENPRHPLNTH